LPRRRLGRTRRRHAGLALAGLVRRARGETGGGGQGPSTSASAGGKEEEEVALGDRLWQRSASSATIDHEPPPPSGLSPSTHPALEVEERSRVALGRRRRSMDLAPTSFSTVRPSSSSQCIFPLPLSLSLFVHRSVHA
jgi:hypothetical protein